MHPTSEASDFFLDHVRSPCGRGELPTATQSASRRNPVCGDEVTLRMDIEENTIREAGFDHRGCSVSLAATSILCEHIQGQAAAAMKTLGPDGMLRLLRIPISPGRRPCALLAYEALQSILAPIDADPRHSSR